MTKKNILAIILILCPFLLGFQMYSPEKKETIIIIQDDNTPQTINSIRGDHGDLVELTSGVYSLVLTQEIGNESYANIITNKGQILTQLKLDKETAKGGKTIHIGQKGWYTIQALGSDSARAKIYRGRYSENTEKKIMTPIEYKGDGKRVIGPFELLKGFYSVSYTHHGKSNFIVKVIANGELKDVLVNEIGFTYGEVGLIIEQSATCFFEIDADGRWNIATFLR